MHDPLVQLHASGRTTDAERDAGFEIRDLRSAVRRDAIDRSGWLADGTPGTGGGLTGWWARVHHDHWPP